MEEEGKFLDWQVMRIKEIVREMKNAHQTILKTFDGWVEDENPCMAEAAHALAESAEIKQRLEQKEYDADALVEQFDAMLACVGNPGEMGRQLKIFQKIIKMGKSTWCQAPSLQNMVTDFIFLYNTAMSQLWQNKTAPSASGQEPSR